MPMLFSQPDQVNSFEEFQLPEWEPEDDPEFFHWLHQIDQRLIAAIGLDHNHLPDQCYADWFEDGWTVEEAASTVLDEMGEEL